MGKRSRESLNRLEMTCRIIFERGGIKMNSNLIRYKIGSHVLVWRNNWDYGRVIEVKVLAKAPHHVKVEAISEGYFIVGSTIWLPIDVYFVEYWQAFSSAPKPKED